MEREVMFQFMVPVVVKVVDGIVRRVFIIDSAPVSNAAFVHGDPDYLREGIEASLNGQSWPGWEFG